MVISEFSKRANLCRYVSRAGEKNVPLDHGRDRLSVDLSFWANSKNKENATE